MADFVDILISLISTEVEVGELGEVDAMQLLD